jgi:hypothetical protein
MVARKIQKKNTYFSSCRYARTETGSDVVRLRWMVRRCTKLANITRDKLQINICNRVELGTPSQAHRTVQQSYKTSPLKYIRLSQHADV